MRFKSLIAGLLALLMVGGFIGAPTIAAAQSHRQKSKNTWRNAAYASAGLGVLGAVNHNSTLTWLGVGGAIYSANRYEQDRKSQSRAARARAAMFSRRSFRRNGHTYRRYTTYRKGTKYYYFKRVS